MNEKKIFFTGGNGFVGKEIIPLLKEDGYTVIAPSSSQLDLKNHQSVNEYFDSNGFDYYAIVHAAVLGGSRLKEDDSDVYYDNMKMFENIFSYASNVDRFINFDSGASLYGDDDIPTTPYGFSKYCSARSVNDFEKGTNLKIFGCFGIKEKESRFISTAIKNYIKRKPITIFQDKLMDFFYVNDLYKILKYSLESFPGMIVTRPKNINCVYDRKYYLSDIAEIINGLGEYEVPIIIEDGNRGKPYCGSFTIDLNYIGLEQGLVDLYEYFCKRNI